MRETITVIVPVYNVEPYIERCIESIRNQTYPYLQIILVDDGSTDASGDICDRFARQDPRVQVIHKANGGPVSARKAGLAKAEGAYVGFVDGDDYIDPSMYEELLACLVETDSDFVQTGYVLESQHESKVAPQGAAIFDDFDKCDVIAKYFCPNEDPGMAITGSIWSKLYKRKLIAECHKKMPDDACFGEDLLAVCHCVFASNRFSMKEGAYYHYQIREGSLTCRDGDTTIFSKLGDLYRYLCDAFQQYGCLEQLREKLDIYLIRRMLDYLVPLVKKRETLYLRTYRYPNMEKILGKRLVIYGAGHVGQAYYGQISKQPSCEIVALADTYPARHPLEHVTVKSLDDLNALEFDVVVIAVLDRDAMLKIRQSLIDIGVPEHEIVWDEPRIMVQ